MERNDGVVAGGRKACFLGLSRITVPTMMEPSGKTLPEKQVQHYFKLLCDLSKSFNCLMWRKLLGAEFAGTVLMFRLSQKGKFTVACVFAFSITNLEFGHLMSLFYRERKRN